MAVAASRLTVVKQGVHRVKFHGDNEEACPSCGLSEHVVEASDTHIQEQLEARGCTHYCRGCMAWLTEDSGE